MKSDLSNVKVGDKILTIQHGWTEVVNVDRTKVYSIRTNTDSYTVDGLNVSYEEYPSAFLENPFEKEITREVEEEIIRGFINFHYNTQSVYSDSYLIALSSNMYKYLDQKYKTLPTAEEAAEKLGITVEQLKEIVK